VDDTCAILKAQEECCQLGLDIDNTSGVIAWAIDCFQHNLITKKDTDGLELDWGDHGVILELIRKIAFREGFGNMLAEGSLRASKVVGKGSEKFAFHIKGQELIEGIRSLKGWALGNVVSCRGSTHTRGALSTEARKWSEEDSQRFFGIKTAGDPTTYSGKAKAIVQVEKAASLWDSLGICYFLATKNAPQGINPGELAQLFSLATGIKLSEKDIMKIGERIHNVEKMFNVYHVGFTREDDYPPQRLMEEPVKSGPLKGELLRRADWDSMLDEYYTLHGWQESTSWPTREKLEALDLPECVDRLEEAKQKSVGIYSGSDCSRTTGDQQAKKIVPT